MKEEAKELLRLLYVAEQTHKDRVLVVENYLKEFLQRYKDSNKVDAVVSGKFAEIDLIQVPKVKHFIRDYIKENKYIPNDEIYLHHSNGKIERIKIRA